MRSTRHRRQVSSDLISGLPDLTLPEAHGQVTTSSRKLGRSFIVPAVASHLRSPAVGVRAVERHAAVNGACVPKTAIDEYGNTTGSEQHVWTTTTP